MNAGTKSLAFVVLLIFYAHLFSKPSFGAMPLTTDDAYTVEKGKVQTELAVDFTRQDNHDKELAPSAVITYGLFERMDVGVGSAYVFIHPAEGENENGLGDTGVKLKYHFTDQNGWIPHFAVSGTVKIPTASESKGLGSGKMDLNLNTIFTWNVSKRWQLYSNVGYTFIGEHKAKDELNYSIAAQFALSDKWALVGDIFGVNNFNGDRHDDPISGLVGTQYVLSDNLVVDAGVEIGMNKAAPDYRLTVGLTIFLKP